MGALLVLGGAWFYARAEAAAIPPAEEAPADAEAAAVVSDGGEEVAWSCGSGSWSESPSSSPLLLLTTGRSGWVDVCMRAYLVESSDEGDLYRLAVTAYWTTEDGYAVGPWDRVDAEASGPVTIEVSSSVDFGDSDVVTSLGFSAEQCETGVEGSGMWDEGWVVELADGRPGTLPDVMSEEGTSSTGAWWTIDLPSQADVTGHTLEMTLPPGSEPEFELVVSSSDGSVTATSPAVSGG
ncbi:hypothetical protein [Demequina salsinemoris]|uniref:hypothetical protein n=1 Tax=Demequina salsinemoris TaxID=577470 RepID=UPI00128E0AE5|nr:hypothetical protein [Demequina salsinemoris]